MLEKIGTWQKWASPLWNHRGEDVTEKREGRYVTGRIIRQGQCKPGHAPTYTYTVREGGTSVAWLSGQRPMIDYYRGCPSEEDILAFIEAQYAKKPLVWHRPLTGPNAGQWFKMTPRGEWKEYAR